MNNKKGISLIVLVITILVMIILAGVVIVSLQNDNPINKAKYAKMVDSAQSVRAAISQYVVTAQASIDTDVTVESKMKYILNDKNELRKGSEKIVAVGKPENGKTVKDVLGVDPTSLIGDNFGKFVVNPKTGATTYKISAMQAMNLGIELDNELPDGLEIYNVYTSNASYSEDNCKEYCTRNGSVDWSQKFLVETKDSLWKVNNIVVLVIPCNDGLTEFRSYQKVSNENYLLPTKKYWKVKTK